MTDLSLSKSWTDEENEKGAKGGGLVLFFLIIIACIGVVLWMLAPNGISKVYAVSLSVGKYSDDLPEPAFSSWDPQNIGFEITERFHASNANQISLESIGEKVGKQSIVVVYLRGHALVINDELYLLAGNFRKEDVLSNMGKNARKLKDIFRELNGLPASSVLVLADICDLPSVPSFGVVANNVAELLERDLAALKKGTPVWVIASAASLQPTHVSLLRKQTLLQAAMQYALDGRACQPEETEISLAQAYESALRYADVATESSQTPVLFRSGTEGRIHNTSEHWLEAQKIRLRMYEPPKSNNTEKVAENPESEKTVSKPSSEPSTAKPETSAGNGASADQPERMAEIETSPWLRFWQLRESFRRRQTSTGWSPIDFDLVRVRQHELKATQLEQLRWMQANSEDATKKMERLVQEWDTVVKTVDSGSESGEDELVDSWHSLQKKLKVEPEKQAWNDPQVLAPELAKQFQPVREDYRRYMDATSELSGWLQQCIEECTQDSDMIARVKGLLDEFKTIDDQLPSQGKTQAVLNNPLDRMKVDAITNALAELRKSSDEKLDKLAAQVKPAMTDPNQSIRWVDEQRFLKYMNRTNSSFASRKRLVEAFEAVEKNPNSLSDPAMREDRRSVEEILLKVDEKLAFDKYRDASELLRHSIMWATGNKLKEVPADSVASLNQWAAEALLPLGFDDPNVSRDVPQRWKQACLSDFLSQGKDEDQLAMLLAVSDDKSLRVVASDFRLDSISKADEFLASANLSLARNNNAVISEYYLKWDISEPNAASAAAENLKLTLLDGGEVRAATPSRITPIAKRTRVDLAFKVAGIIRQPAEGSALNLSLLVSDDERGTQNRIVQPLKLAFPSPDRIELLAKCLDIGDQQFVPVEIVDGEDHVNALRVPAIEQAKSNYQFYVKNHSEKSKTLTASFYSVIDRSQSFGTGFVTKTARQYTMDEIKQKQLPKRFTTELMSFTPSEQKPIHLTVAPAADASADSTPEFPFGEFGLVCVIEEYTPAANSDDKPTKTSESYHWISCRPENPMAREVVVTDSALKAASGPRRDFNLSITVPESVWPRWQLEQIALAASLTDRNGKTIKNADISFNPNAKLTAVEPTTSIEVTANPPFDGPAILHLDIGGYPRAVNFEARESNGFKAANSQRAFAWIDELECLSKEEPIKTERLAGSYIVPVRIPLESSTAYQDIDVSDIKFTMRMDNPNGKGANLTFEASSVSAAQSKTLKSFLPPYRKFRPNFVVKDGILVFSALASDLDYQYPAPPQKNGKLTFGIQFEESRVPAATSDVVFDRQPPELPRNISVQPDSISTTDDVRLEVEVRDAESDVAQVFFDFSEKPPSLAQLVPLTSPLLPPLTATKSTGEKWGYLLSGKELKPLKEGKYYVTCRSIDLAGNVRVGPSKRIDWRGDEVAPAPVVPKTVAASPPAKKEYDVQVVLTVQGAKPKYPEKISVSGISGQQLHLQYSTRTFSGVPAGDYNVSAECDFLGKFEGKGRVTVPSQTSVTIDLKPAK